MTHLRRLLFLLFGALFSVTGTAALELAAWFESFWLLGAGAATLLLGVILLGMALASWNDV